MILNPDYPYTAVQSDHLQNAVNKFLAKQRSDIKAFCEQQRTAIAEIGILVDQVSGVDRNDETSGPVSKQIEDAITSHLAEDPGLYQVTYMGPWEHELLPACVWPTHPTEGIQRWDFCGYDWAKKAPLYEFIDP